MGVWRHCLSLGQCSGSTLEHGVQSVWCWGAAVCIISKMHSSLCEVTPGGLQKRALVDGVGMAKWLGQHLQWDWLVDDSSAHAGFGLLQQGCWCGDARIHLAA